MQNYRAKGGKLFFVRLCLLTTDYMCAHRAPTCGGGGILRLLVDSSTLMLLLNYVVQEHPRRMAPCVITVGKRCYNIEVMCFARV